MKSEGCKILSSGFVVTGHIADLSKSSRDVWNIDVIQRKSTPSWGETAEFAPLRQVDLALLTGRLQSDFKTIEKIVCEIAEGIKTLQEKPIAYTAYLCDLGTKKYKLRKPINIVIEVYEDEVIAKLPELEIFGSGNTEAEAILGFKEEIIDLYIELVNSSEKELGRLPKMWRRILKQLISCR